jgi:fatty acid desaturase
VDRQPSSVVEPGCGTQAVRPDAEYELLRQLIAKESLFDKAPAYYWYKIGTAFFLLAVAIALLTGREMPLVQLADAGFLALAFTQLSFLVHDAGHGQVFRSTRKNNALGMFIANFVLGMSYFWWNEKHNRHHRFPNHLLCDPDLNVPLLSFSAEQATQKRGIPRFVAKYQAYVFVPLMLLGAMAQRRGSIVFICRHRYNRRSIEISAITLHYILYCTLVFSNLGLWPGFLFIVLHQGAYGLFMTSVFAQNHKGMPLMGESNAPHFLRQQVITARNAATHPVFDFWYGGLNYQIEHHLFPGMPRCRLKKAQKIVEAFCESRSIVYCKQPFGRAVLEVFKYLHSVGIPLRIPNTR